jgi:hypothetical protein
MSYVCIGFYILLIQLFKYSSKMRPIFILLYQRKRSVQSAERECVLWERRTQSVECRRRLPSPIESEARSISKRKMGRASACRQLPFHFIMLHRQELCYLQLMILYYFNLLLLFSSQFNLSDFVTPLSVVVGKR